MNNNGAKLITAFEEDSPFAEAYRVLRFNLLPQNGERLWSVGVTSVAPGHGSTTTATNLALIAAESGSRIVLVDADLHKPSLHSHFGISNDIGLTTVLRGEISPERALRSVGERPTLRLMPAGPTVRNPSALLQPAGLKKILDGLREFVDLLIVDLPSVGAVAYTSFLATLLDGLLLVVRAGTSPVSADRIVKHRLQGVNVLGMVLNQAPMQASETPSHRQYVNPKV